MKQKFANGMLKSCFVSLLCLFIRVPDAMAESLCTVIEKRTCNSGSSCKATKPTIEVRVDWKANIYKRCDSKGCDELPMQFALSGDYIVIDLPGRGALAKISKDGLQFVEVVTLMSTVLVSFGNCQIR